MNVNDQRSIEKALRESEARVQVIADAVPVLIWETDKTGAIFVNQHYLDFFGVGFDDVRAMGWTRFVHPEDFEVYAAVYLTAFTERRPLTHDVRLLRADGQYRWTRTTGRPLGEDRYVGVCLDITESKEAEDRLRNSEERQAFLLKLSDALRPLANVDEIKTTAAKLLGERLKVDRAGYGELLADGKMMAVRADWVRNGTPTVLGVYAIDDFGSFFSGRLRAGEIAVTPDAAVQAGISQEMYEKTWKAIGVRSAIACPVLKENRLAAALFIHHPIERQWSAEEIELVSRAAERTWDAIERAHVETAARGSEQRARFLLSELQHRVRNTLAVVRSIAARTGETAENVESYSMHLDSRLNAFARVQAAVTRDPAVGIDLKELIADELLAHVAKEDEQVRISGPDLRLTPKAAETLGLAIHELTTNSVKYGALAAPQGNISVSWEIGSSQNGGAVFEFQWVEQGADIDISAARRRGFGMVLLEQTLAYELDAKAKLQFKPSGLHCTLTIPLTERFASRKNGG